MQIWKIKIYGEMSPTVDWSHASKAINLAIITTTTIACCAESVYSKVV